MDNDGQARVFKQWDPEAQRLFGCTVSGCHGMHAAKRIRQLPSPCQFVWPCSSQVPKPAQPCTKAACNSADSCPTSLCTCCGCKEGQLTNLCPGSPQARQHCLRLLEGEPPAAAGPSAAAPQLQGPGVHQGHPAAAGDGCGAGSQEAAPSGATAAAVAAGGSRGIAPPNLPPAAGQSLPLRPSRRTPAADEVRMPAL
jgi:hypothetical protein